MSSSLDSINKSRPQKLAQKGSRSSGSSYSYRSYSGYGYGYGYYNRNDGDTFGFGGLILGICLIPFSFICLWKNEKKQVTFDKVIRKAEKECKTVDVNNPNGADDKILVFLSGQSNAEEELVDEVSSISVNNCYRLKKVVEMHQWVEHRREEKNGDETRVWYEYNTEWKEEIQNSANFHDSGYDNPEKMPFSSETYIAQNAQVGGFFLQKEHCRSLGTNETMQLDEQQKDSILIATKEQLQSYQLGYWEQNGENLVAKSQFTYGNRQNNDADERVGDVRIRYEKAPVGMVYMIGQQCYDDKSNFTVRMWNPEKRDALYGDDMSGESDRDCGSCSYCYCCAGVNWMMAKLFEETVYKVSSDQFSPQTYFDDMKQKLKMSNGLRCLGFLGVWLGFYLLFSPIMALFAWIPLIGGLLKSIISFAALIATFFVAVTSSLLVIAIAWIFYRPLIGVPLLLATGAGIFAMFYFGQPMSQEEAEGLQDGSSNNSTDNGNSTEPNSDQNEQSQPSLILARLLHKFD